MERNSIELATDRHIIDLDPDKDTWIYTYGSAKLQQIRSFGYECEERYLKERLATEYRGFKINQVAPAHKLDFPPLYAIRESLKWQGAYVAKHYLQGEVIAIDNYLDRYQIIKKTNKPWYLGYQNLSNEAQNCLAVIIFTIVMSGLWALLFFALR